MCGIFLCQTKENNAPVKVLDGLKKLEYRGYDSWGIASIVDNKLNLQKYVGKVSDGKIDMYDSHLSLGHTRWATHGKVCTENSHPHASMSGRFVVVHNGIFENYLDFKKILLENGFKFYSETDTEVIVNWVEYKMKDEESLEKVVKKLFKEINGGNAFIILDTQTKDVVVAKNGSPLHIGKTSDGLIVSSDRVAVLEETPKIYSLNDGEVINLNNISKIDFTIEKKIVSKETENTFPYYMLKEIFDQEESIEKGFVKNKSLEKVLGANWYKGKTIFASGCGTAYHAALMFSVLSAQVGINVRAIPANESESVSRLIDKNTVLFLFSQSGETADSIIFAKEVLKKGGKVYSVLNAEQSTLSQLSTKTFYIYSGKEIAVASTKAYMGMISASLKLLGYKISKKEFEKIKEFIKPELIDKVKEIVKENINSKDLFVIGKGVENIVALETALKIKEISYIHAEGFAAGELKHGVLALIEEQVLTICLSGNKKFEADLENSALQIRARGGKVLGIGLKQQPSYDYFISIPESDNLYAIFSAIVGQVIGYEFSIARGNNPDKPRNLAKSVTVK
jgi:glucosamine--fructose-6-phosphate aminotransferase (isomerizing)